MSVTYFYLNHDKQQFFSCGFPNLRSKIDRIGTEPGSRALAILLSDFGTWQGDRISVVNDCDPQLLDAINHGVEIEIELELMMIDFDRAFLQWLEERLDLMFSESVFERLCYYAILLRHQKVTELLDRKYGVGKWQLEYEKYVLRYRDRYSKEVIDAKNRGLQLLKSTSSS